MLVDLDADAPADTIFPLLTASLFSVSSIRRMSSAFTEGSVSPGTTPHSEETPQQAASDAASISPSVAHSSADHSSSTPDVEQKSTSSQSRSASHKQNRRLSARKSFSSRPINVFHPRPYEDVYAEQAYLSVTFQSHINKVSDLIHKYSLAEEESIHGESRKCKRAARKQIGILRGQLIHAAEQEQAIFVRLGELYVETKSRETWDVARKQRPPRVKRPSQTQVEPDIRPRSKSNLNGATPEFIPRKDLLHHLKGDGSVVSTESSEDGERGNRVGGNGSGSDSERYNSELGENRLKFLFMPSNNGVIKQRKRRMSGDGGCEAFKQGRRLSLPNMGSARPP